MTHTITRRPKNYNEAHRSGKPLICDHEYDVLIQKLRELDPNHPFLHLVEPEKFEVKKEIRHPAAML